MDKTQFIIQHHLDETHECLSRGQDELKLALTAIEQGQSTWLLHWRQDRTRLHIYSCRWYMAGNHKIMKGTMGLVDLMEERDITQRLVTGPTLRGKVYLGVQTTGCQGVAGSHPGLTCLVS
jgi:hypothetical protein